MSSAAFREIGPDRAVRPASARPTDVMIRYETDFEKTVRDCTLGELQAWIVREYPPVEWFGDRAGAIPPISGGRSSVAKVSRSWLGCFAADPRRNPPSARHRALSGRIDSLSGSPSGCWPDTRNQNLTNHENPTSNRIRLLLAASGCATSRRLAEIEPTFAATESTWLHGSEDADVVNRRLKPIERPQVRFEVERAVWHVDSAWVVVRVTIPHRSIRRSECFKAMSVLQVPEGIMELGELTLDSGHFTPDKEDEGVDVATRPGRMQNLYLSWRFAWDERIRDECLHRGLPKLDRRPPPVPVSAPDAADLLVRRFETGVLLAAVGRDSRRDAAGVLAPLS